MRNIYKVDEHANILDARGWAPCWENMYALLCIVCVCMVHGEQQVHRGPILVCYTYRKNIYLYIATTRLEKYNSTCATYIRIWTYG